MVEREIAIVSAVRTPIGSFNGQFRDMPAAELGAVAIRASLQLAGVDATQVDEVLMGNVLQAGLGQNPARQASLMAGLPVETPATTVNQVCGSGLKAVQLAVQAIRCGDSEIVAAGGMENMSLAPYLLQGARSGYRMGDQTAKDSMISDGLWCAHNQYHMGVTAENLCDRYGYTRLQLDEIALESQRKAAATAADGIFREEIVPVDVPQRKGKTLSVETDEYLRPGTTMEALSALQPAFKPDGMVTAGNSSGINDGAAALLLMSGSRARELGLHPLAFIRAHASAGVDPAYMGTGPIPATELALRRAGLSMDDIDLIEANEAFAAQSLVFAEHFGLDGRRLNVRGGAIALGHPIGASGARIMVTLLHEMRRRQARYGLATLCVGGGQGVSVIVENNLACGQ